MKNFMGVIGKNVLGVLSGFDRLVLRGTMRMIAHTSGMLKFLSSVGVLLKDFGPYVERTSMRLKEASTAAARASGRPVEYLPSAQGSKEEVALKIATRDAIRQGLIAVLSAVEPCVSFEIHRNRQERVLELRAVHRKCLFLYHYFIHPIFGFMHARIQTWFPFTIQVCLNGRDWAAREMDRAGIGYRRRDNCFVEVDDIARAQEILNRQRSFAWRRPLQRISRMLNPLHSSIFHQPWMDYYWSVHQSEWATDLMFRDPQTLQAVYPGLVRQAMDHFSSGDVMRFLGRKVTGAFGGEILGDFKDRFEGVRVKHRVDANSIKMYDKQGSVLRVETTINDPHPFKVFRTKEGDPDGERDWRALRKGIADIHRRAVVSQAANTRYLDALTPADCSMSLGRLVDRVTRPVTRQGQRTRALRPWSPDDHRLLKAVHRGEYKLAGFRNRDLQADLFDGPADTPEEKKRRSAQVTRRIRMLRAQGLVKKVPRTHRYHLTAKGIEVVTAVLTAHDLTLKQVEAAKAA